MACFVDIHGSLPEEERVRGSGRGKVGRGRTGRRGGNEGGVTVKKKEYVS